MRTRRSSALAALVIAGLTSVLLAGCADSDGEPAQPGGSMSATPTPSGSGRDPSTGPSFDATPVPPSGGSGAAKSGEITVTGSIEEGVEPNCILLKTADKSYLLLGGDRALIQQGGRLTVRGTPQPDLMTTCQQGEPFRVAEAKRA